MNLALRMLTSHVISVGSTKGVISVDKIVHLIIIPTMVGVFNTQAKIILPAAVLQIDIYTNLI